MDELSFGKKISIIIPAFNEEKRIAPVIKTALSHPLAAEVIVVDDGSKDQTAEIARSSGASVIKLEKNSGKATAMDVGVSHSSSEIICFLDADISGLTTQMIDLILEPVLSGRCEMFVAVRRRQYFWMNELLHIFPIIGGERALTRRLWLLLPLKYKKGFQIEIALNYFCKRVLRARMGHAIVAGLKGVSKSRKQGYFRGLWRNCGMSAEIIAISMKLYIGQEFKKMLYISQKKRT